MSHVKLIDKLFGQVEISTASGQCFISLVPKVVDCSACRHTSPIQWLATNHWWAGMKIFVCKELETSKISNFVHQRYHFQLQWRWLRWAMRLSLEHIPRIEKKWETLYMLCSVVVHRFLIAIYCSQFWYVSKVPTWPDLFLFPPPNKKSVDNKGGQDGTKTVCSNSCSHTLRPSTTSDANESRKISSQWRAWRPSALVFLGKLWRIWRL